MGASSVPVVVPSQMTTPLASISVAARPRSRVISSASRTRPKSVASEAAAFSAIACRVATLVSSACARGAAGAALGAFAGTAVVGTLAAALVALS